MRRVVSLDRTLAESMKTARSIESNRTLVAGSLVDTHELRAL
jgi:hypothetical protein